MRHVVVIGAGIGGLAAALRLSHAGLKVTVLEQHAAPGGKMRTVPSVAGPVDAGPTVLTLKPVFEQLFTDTGAELADHVNLKREAILARHFWLDGTTLDLMADPEHSRENVAQAFGQGAAAEFCQFADRARTLYDAFDAPMMRNAAPSQSALTVAVARRPALLALMAPHQTLAQMLKRSFSNPKLAQLFGRYATYVGGRPDASPALLSLIWHAEQLGVWHVDGGMHVLAQAIEKRARSFGTTFHYNSHVTRIEVQDGKASAVHTDAGRLSADCVLFNGDPRALRTGALGPGVRSAIPADATEPRSLSAFVHAFAARPEGIDLAAHNIFFGATPDQEFGALAQGRMPHDPTLYICAQDRFGGAKPTEPERFEIIMNGAPVLDNTAPSPQEIPKCQTLVFGKLRDFGLHFSPRPEPSTLTTPEGFSTLFPATNGSLYGRSPHGLMAAFKRPQTRSRIPGLYLVGGGVHPGAGVPMATLCAAHAAAAILNDPCSTSRSRQAVTRGGTSTESAPMAAAPSRSSPS